jgi:hypothetical protein
VLLCRWCWYHQSLQTCLQKVQTQEALSTCPGAPGVGSQQAWRCISSTKLLPILYAKQLCIDNLHKCCCCCCQLPTWVACCAPLLICCSVRARRAINTCAGYCAAICCAGSADSKHSANRACGTLRGASWTVGVGSNAGCACGCAGRPNCSRVGDCRHSKQGCETGLHGDITSQC